MIYKNSSRQYLKLYTYPGNGCCQYFEVGYLLKQNIKAKQTALKFETESKIYLGMSISAFKKLKDVDKMSKRKTNGLTVYEYSKYSEELSQVRYSSRWVFKNNLLVKFGFGNTAYNP